MSSTTKAYADDATSSTTTDTTTTSTTASVTVSSSCTMTSTIDTPHTATVAGGTYTENIGKTTIKTFCNDPNGYALYAIGYTDNTYGTTTLKGTSTENTIPTGTYTSGTTTNSVWSMKLNSVPGTYTPTIENSFNNYSQIPSDFTKVATYANNTDIEVNGSGIGSSVETTYAAYISGAQAADTYTGQVKYVLVHPNTAKLLTMQEFSDDDADALGIGESTTLLDNRDDNFYTVAKMPDGNVWMTQNLRITHSTGQPEGTILATGSNFSSKEKVELTNDTDFNYATPQYHTPTEADLEQSGLTVNQVGAWYNFCAASAVDTDNYGCDASTEYTGHEDICPAGWHLPNNAGNNTGGEIFDLKTMLNADSAAMLAFNPVYGGSYQNGSIFSVTSSSWWSSTRYMAGFQFRLSYSNSGSLSISFYGKNTGYFIRCVRSGA